MAQGRHEGSALRGFASHHGQRQGRAASREDCHSRKGLVFDLGLRIAIQGGGGIRLGWRLARCLWKCYNDACKSLKLDLSFTDD
jgi:hypothetical protein